MENTQEYKNKFLILINVIMMTFMATLDGSIVNIALPTMAIRLGVPEQSVSWVIVAYLMAITAAILIFGRLGDIKGKTKIFKIGIIVFTFGSLLCVFSDSLGTLVFARVVQGIGGAAFMATNQGIITQVFPKGERGRALGISGMAVALGTMLGPPLGGFIISIFSWKTIFFINVPIGVIVYLLSIRILPKSLRVKQESIDIKGAVLFVLAILCLFLSLQIGQMPRMSMIMLFGVLIALIIIFIFVKVERNIEVPFLQLDIFKNKLFSVSIFCAFIPFFVMSSSNIIQPFYLQNVLKLTPAYIGWIMIIFPLTLSIVAPISGYLSDKIGSEILTILGLSFMSCGMYLMSTLNENSNILNLIIFIIIMSIGNGLFQSPNTSLIMSIVPQNKLGVVGSINGLVRNLGMIFGVALSTAFLYYQMSRKLGYPVNNFIEGHSKVFVYGMRSVYIATALMCFLGVVITLYRFWRKKNCEKLCEEIIID